MPTNSRKHGLYGLIARVKARGMGALDRRSIAFKVTSQWKQELLEALGGVEHVSAQTTAVVELIVRTQLYVDHLDCWLVKQRSLVSNKTKTVVPVMRVRQSMVDSLARLYAMIGLDRRARPVEDLQAYLRRKEAENASAGQPDDEEPQEVHE